jgi:hypothetical protein
MLVAGSSPSRDTFAHSAGAQNNLASAYLLLLDVALTRRNLNRSLPGVREKSLVRKCSVNPRSSAESAALRRAPSLAISSGFSGSGLATSGDHASPRATWKPQNHHFRKLGRRRPMVSLGTAYPFPDIALISC